MLKLDELMTQVAGQLSTPEHPFLVRYVNSFDLANRREGYYIEPGNFQYSVKQTRTRQEEHAICIIVEKLLHQGSETLNEEIRNLVAEMQTLARGFLPGMLCRLSIPNAHCHSITTFGDAPSFYSIQAAEGETPWFLGGFQANFLILG